MGRDRKNSFNNTARVSMNEIRFDPFYIVCFSRTVIARWFCNVCFQIRIGRNAVNSIRCSCCVFYYHTNKSWLVKIAYDLPLSEDCSDAFGSGSQYDLNWNRILIHEPFESSSLLYIYNIFPIYRWTIKYSLNFKLKYRSTDLITHRLTSIRTGIRQNVAYIHHIIFKRVRCIILTRHFFFM